MAAVDLTGRPKPWDRAGPAAAAGGWLAARDAVDGANYLALYIEW